MKTQKLMVVLASVALGLGLAGCTGSAGKKAEDIPKPPSISQVEKQKQQEAKAKAEAEAKAKAEQEAKAKAEAEAKAKADAAAKAPAPAPAKAQPKARSYQPKARSYQRKVQPKRHYQAPRRSGTKAAPKPKGNSGPKTVTQDGSVYRDNGDGTTNMSFCGDSEGNTWPC